MVSGLAAARSLDSGFARRRAPRGDCAGLAHAASAATRLRPSRLARYIAWSARLMISDGLSSDDRIAAMPIEIVACTVRVFWLIGNGSAAMRRRSRSPTPPALAVLV